MSRTTCPVHLKEKVEVVRRGIEYAVGEDADDIAQCRLHGMDRFPRHRDGDWQHRTDGRHIVACTGRLELFQAAVKVGIRFDDMQMCVLRLGEIRIQLRQAHISDGTPITCRSLDIAVMLMVKSMLLNTFKELESIVKRLLVARCPRKFRQSVDCETDGVELFACVEGITFCVETPKYPTIFMVDEMVDEIVLCARGNVEIF